MTNRMLWPFSLAFLVAACALLALPKVAKSACDTKCRMKLAARNCGHICLKFTREDCLMCPGWPGNQLCDTSAGYTTNKNHCRAEAAGVELNSVDHYNTCTSLCTCGTGIIQVEADALTMETWLASVEPDRFICKVS